jgi:hypothetical protein
MSSNQNDNNKSLTDERNKQNPRERFKKKYPTATETFNQNLFILNNNNPFLISPYYITGDTKQLDSVTSNVDILNKMINFNTKTISADYVQPYTSGNPVTIQVDNGLGGKSTAIFGNSSTTFSNGYDNYYQLEVTGSVSASNSVESSMYRPYAGDTSLTLETTNGTITSSVTLDPTSATFDNGTSAYQLNVDGTTATNTIQPYGTNTTLTLQTTGTTATSFTLAPNTATFDASGANSFNLNIDGTTATNIIQPYGTNTSLTLQTSDAGTSIILSPNTVTFDASGINSFNFNIDGTISTNTIQPYGTNTTITMQTANATSFTLAPNTATFDTSGANSFNLNIDGTTATNTIKPYGTNTTLTLQTADATATSFTLAPNTATFDASGANSFTVNIDGTTATNTITPYGANSTITFDTSESNVIMDISSTTMEYLADISGYTLDVKGTVKTSYLTTNTANKSFYFYTLDGSTQKLITFTKNGLLSVLGSAAAITGLEANLPAVKCFIEGNLYVRGNIYYTGTAGAPPYTPPA